MFTLIALLTHTTLGNYTTIDSCQDAIRQVYTFQIDPLGLIHNQNSAALKTIIDNKMKYSAPREYLCQKQ